MRAILYSTERAMPVRLLFPCFKPKFLPQPPTGRLMRTILYSTERVTANNWETGLFICFLLIWAIAASGYVLYHGLQVRVLLVGRWVEGSWVGDVAATLSSAASSWRSTAL